MNQRVESKIKVVLADDYAVLLRGLDAVLSKDEEIEIVGQVKDGVELVDFFEEHTADVAIVDIRMPNMNGIEASKKIKEKYPEVRILILTTFDNDEYINQFLEAKIEGYLLKGSEERLLCHAVKSIYHGMNAIDKVIVSKISEGLSSTSKIRNDEILTLMEQKVAEFIIRGYYNKDIANELDISYGRVRNIVSSIYQKVGVSSRAELIEFKQD